MNVSVSILRCKIIFQILALHFFKKLCCGHSKLIRAPSDATYDYPHVFMENLNNIANMMKQFLGKMSIHIKAF